VTERLNGKMQAVKQMACILKTLEHYNRAIIHHGGEFDLSAST